MSNITKKEHIIEAALNVFIARGFLGASMNQIAEAAEVNKSLIYHYFKSKEDLWIHAKRFCVNEALHDCRDIRYDTIENFVNDLVSVRFSVYNKSSMRMMCHWQALEPDPSKFYERNEEFAPHALFDIAHHIQKLKERQIIHKDLDTKTMSALFFTLSSYAYFDFANAFEFPKEQEESYKKCVCNILINALAEKR